MAPETVVLDVEVAVSDSSPPGAATGHVSTKDLERRLTSHAGHMAVAEARWLGWLDQWVQREGWAEWGCSGPTAWLSWQCGMSPSTGREKVRVAGALRDLPTISARFAEGRLSYSKVRALTRIATPESEGELAVLAIAATGAQLDVIVRAYQQARAADDHAATAWHGRSWRSRADGADSTVFTLRVPNDQAELIRERIAGEVDQLIRDSIGVAGRQSRDDVLESRGEYRAIAADAVVAIINGTSRTATAPPVDVQVVVNDDDHSQHVEYAIGSTAVPVATGERLCCNPRIAVLVEQSKGTVLGVGRTTRIIGRKLRRALERRDQGMCSFAGCASTKGLHAHHIIHWANGGPTELANLILVCSFHHHLVHEGGWSIDPLSHQFIQPDGTVIDVEPFERFRGSASQIITEVGFDSLAPLGEARNEPYDLGLVLESLADLHTDIDQPQPHHDRCSHQTSRSYGPPIPRTIAEESERHIALKRFRGSASFNAGYSVSGPPNGR